MTPRIALEGMGVALRSSLTTAIESWGGTVVDPLEGQVDAIIVQLSSGAEVSQRIPFESESARQIWIAQPADVGRLRQDSDRVVLASPVRISDLRAALSDVLGQVYLESVRVRADAAAGPLKVDGRLPRILLAEDNLVNQRVFTMMLRRMGLSAEVVGSGADAFEAVLKEAFDLVFMDYQMPVMDGIEATIRIREAGKMIRQPRIIGFTANVQANAIQQMQQAGMDSYLSKPVKFDDLREVITRSLGRRAGEQSESDFTPN